MKNTTSLKTRREEYADATREALVSAAKSLFMSQGYHQVSVESIAQAARATRGAFYHYFAGKPELLDDLVVTLQSDAASRVRAATVAEPESGRLGAGLRTFLDAASEPEYRYLVIEAAPAILGVNRCREIEEQSTFGLLIAAAQADPRPNSVIARNTYLGARMVGSMVCEAAQLIENAENPSTFKADVLAIVEQAWKALTDPKFAQ